MSDDDDTTEIVRTAFYVRGIAVDWYWIGTAERIHDLKIFASSVNVIRSV